MDNKSKRQKESGNKSKLASRHASNAANVVHPTLTPVNSKRPVALSQQGNHYASIQDHHPTQLHTNNKQKRHHHKQHQHQQQHTPPQQQQKFSDDCQLGHHCNHAYHNQSWNRLNFEAESDNIQCSLDRSIDPTIQLTCGAEHGHYCGNGSYDEVMLTQRKSLDEMMNKLFQCPSKSSSGNSNGGEPQQPRDQRVFHQYDSSSLTYESLQRDNSDIYATKTTTTNTHNISDVPVGKYDACHNLNESIHDRIGKNLDNPSGIIFRDAQQQTNTSVEVSQLSNKSMSNNNNARITMPAQNLQHEKKAQLSSSSSSGSNFSNKNLSTSSSSLSLQMLQQQQQQKFNESAQMSPQQHLQRAQQPRYSNSLGGYFGKQRLPNQRYVMLENKNIARPQDRFREKIDNSYRPFEPLLKVKPNARTPLRLNIEYDALGNQLYSHPYEYEIRQFPLRPELFTTSEPIEPLELHSTPINWVETVEELEAMCLHIEEQKEFAVDVEHHSYRSFQGITCLLQISTRTHDFVIDAIELRDQLFRLNQSFTNPDIVKVFHGADCDILWLQRDFGVYVVNLFDTSRAAKLMKFAQLSLAFLMKHYCNIEPDKSYQLADWRERPLRLPMLQYARVDTHYLLYIYDKLRNDLLAQGGHNSDFGKDLLENVYERGREICLKRYEKPPLIETSHLSILRKSRSTFDAQQMFALKELYAWRDSVSRELDESVGYVLPNNLMLRLAEALPKEAHGITALCNPIPPAVKKYLSDIHEIILKAISVPLEPLCKNC